MNIEPAVEKFRENFRRSFEWNNSDEKDVAIVLSFWASVNMRAFLSDPMQSQAALLTAFYRPQTTLRSELAHEAQAFAFDTSRKQEIASRLLSDGGSPLGLQPYYFDNYLNSAYESVLAPDLPVGAYQLFALAFGVPSFDHEVEAYMRQKDMEQIFINEVFFDITPGASHQDMGIGTSDLSGNRRFFLRLAHLIQRQGNTVEEIIESVNEDIDWSIRRDQPDVMNLIFALRSIENNREYIQKISDEIDIRIAKAGSRLKSVFGLTDVDTEALFESIAGFETRPTTDPNDDFDDKDDAGPDFKEVV